MIYLIRQDICKITFATSAFLLLQMLLSSCNGDHKGLHIAAPSTLFACPPCDRSCDTLTFAQDGICPHCNMNLIMKLDSSEIDQFRISSGSGNFLISGGVGHEGKLITVFYHLPKAYNQDSEILMVIPGAGRNGDGYRDSWIAASEKYNVVILSPQYIEENYDFGGYHMAGMISNVGYDHDFTFESNDNQYQWIYNDFDRLFVSVTQALGSSRETYDMFGHSAGGQILHRMVLFHQSQYADRILASNSGWYTLPDEGIPLPYGIQGTVATKESLDASFARNLTLFIGEEDNASETRGTLQKSARAMQQGAHRLARAGYFYRRSKEIADEFDQPYNWNLVIVPDVGHDYRNMGEAAANYLYAYKSR